MLTKTTENTGSGSPHIVCDSSQGTDMQGNLDHNFLITSGRYISPCIMLISLPLLKAHPGVD